MTRKYNVLEKLRNSPGKYMALVILLCFLNATAVSAKPLQIKIFFSNFSQNFNDCGAVGFAYRKIPKTKNVANNALKLLFAGPTAKEKAKGLESIKKLGTFYIGVSVKNRKAVVNFRRGAEKYLYVSGPICMSQTVSAPIEKTLLQFGNIKSVDYAIDGKIVEDWDA